MATRAAKLRIQLHRKLLFLLEPHRYKVAWGGRGGGKSYGFADASLFLAIRRPLRILCAREFQISIADSVHYLLKTRIAALADNNPDIPINDIFNVQKQTITTSNGSEFIFSGIRTNVNKIRSMEAVDICWVEEAQAISADSWDVLIPTIRKPGSEIWVTFNRDQETDPTDVKFLGKNGPPPRSIVREIGWWDNPWISKDLLDEKDHLYSVDPEAADHVWGGKTKTRSKAQVLHSKWVIVAFEPGEDWHGPYYGVDWGTVHPTVMVKCWITGGLDSNERELWVEHEAFGVGKDIDEYPDLFDRVPGSRAHVSRADGSRPETISHMKRNGFPRMTAAPKWPGSVEDGIEHLRGYKRINIHQRCKHAIDQAKLWSWKTDRLNGDVLPQLIDLNDDIWDAVRYALAPVIRRRKISFV